MLVLFRFRTLHKHSCDCFFWFAKIRMDCFSLVIPVKLSREVSDFDSVTCGPCFGMQSKEHIPKLLCRTFFN